MHLDHLPGSFFGPSNLVDLLRHRAAHQSNDLGFLYLVDGEKEEIRWTYAELDRRARAIAAWLQSRNLQGERALLLYPTGLDFVAAFFGCVYAGVVAVPAYPPRKNRSLERIEAIADDAEAKVALSTQEVLDRVQGVLDENPGLRSLHWCATDRFPEGIERDWRQPEVHGDTLAFLQYTSGSTGTPKGVMLSHANLMHNSALISYAFEHTRSGVGVFWLPSYHDMGLIGGILQPMYYGRPNVLMSPMSFLQRPLRWLQAITKYKGTVSGGPNFAYDLCIRRISAEDRKDLDLSTWVLAFNGAEPIRPETLAEFARVFGPCGFRPEAFYPCYGLAEATLMVTGGLKSALPVVRTFDAKALESNRAIDALPEEEGTRSLVGCGTSLSDQDMAIVDPEMMTQCPVGRIGEIWVAGPSIAQGYWRRVDETTNTFRAYLKDSGRGPYLRTGDLGFVREGELFVTGRLKDLIIVHGRNYYPQDIEATVEHAHRLIRPMASAAFTVDVGRRERLGIVVEVERGRNRTEAELNEVFDAIRKVVSAEHEVPVEAIVLIKSGSIPKTSSGKIQRHACRNGFLRGDELEAIAQWHAWESPLVESAALTPTVEIALAQSTNGHLRSGLADRSSPISTATATIVMEQIAKVAKERAKGLMLDSNILEMSMDSLERMEIVAALEDTFGGRFPEDVLPDLILVRDVVAAVEKYLGKTPRKRDAVPTEETPASHYRVDQFPEYLALKQQWNALAGTGARNPFFTVHECVIDDTTIVGGRELISWSSYNYLGMSGDPVVSEAAKEAVDRFGTSVSASRLVSGEKTIHRELERAIASFVGVEDSVVFVSGHGTNETTIGHLFGPGDLILHDALAHNSIIQGSILSGARRRPFPHNDWQTLDQLLGDLRHEYRRVLIAIEGIYSMDGDYPDLPQFIEVKKKHKAMLLVDEAHSLGVMGPHGRGIGEHFDVDPADVEIWMGTLSKSLGSCGGYVAGGKALIEYLKYTAPGFVFSNGMSPPNAAAALAALRLLEEESERVDRLASNSKLFLALARERGLNTGRSRDSAVVPVILGNSLHALQLSQALFAAGINVQPILHPAVEESAARLRFFITSRHTEDQIRTTVDAVAEQLKKIDPSHLRHKAVAQQQQVGV
ncbi:MAG: aminotransferase class I/II-fold pyridoxal phosphate-dependent enzyme [Pirellulales bacterium]|nr:aminotransferase class I/II-fold pyridoxal phosphate-dependent enzyme [Pirellulales bacterium]